MPCARIDIEVHCPRGWICFRCRSAGLSQNEVPSVVQATDIERNLISDLYQVEFEVDKKDHDLWMDKSGAIKRTKVDIPKRNFPRLSNKKLESEFKGYKINDVDRIEEEGKVSFLVDLDGRSDDR